ncbi:MAG TPA: hypothetical protein VKA34_05495 [Balneolales bacterium]|nr:hypothetical protein [Balneolales bacterium]
MENGPRVFAYATFSTMIGIAIYLFTHQLFRFVQSQGIISVIALAGFFIIYGNMAYAIAKRFDAKAMKGVNFPYVLGLLLVVPTMLYIFFQPQAGVRSAMPLLFVVLAVAGLLGSFLGIKSGLKKRDRLIREYQQSQKEKNGQSVKQPSN